MRGGGRGLEPLHRSTCSAALHWTPCSMPGGWGRPATSSAHGAAVNPPPLPPRRARANTRHSAAPVRAFAQPQRPHAVREGPAKHKGIQRLDPCAAGPLNVGQHPGHHRLRDPQPKLSVEKRSHITRSHQATPQARARPHATVERTACRRSYGMSSVTNRDTMSVECTCG